MQGVLPPVHPTMVSSRILNVQKPLARCRSRSPAAVPLVSLVPDLRRSSVGCGPARLLAQALGRLCPPQGRAHCGFLAKNPVHWTRHWSRTRSRPSTWCRFSVGWWRSTPSWRSCLTWPSAGSSAPMAGRTRSSCARSARFHDGRAVTARPYSQVLLLERACDPTHRSRNAVAGVYLGDIVGAREMLVGSGGCDQWASRWWTITRCASPLTRPRPISWPS